MEKLLLGFRKPNHDEQAEINQGGEIIEGNEKMPVARWYKNRFVHCDLVPNELLKKEALMHDRDVIIGMLSKQ